METRSHQHYRAGEFPVPVCTYIMERYLDTDGYVDVRSGWAWKVGGVPRGRGPPAAGEGGMYETRAPSNVVHVDL